MREYKVNSHVEFERRKRLDLLVAVTGATGTSFWNELRSSELPTRDEPLCKLYVGDWVKEVSRQTKEVHSDRQGSQEQCFDMVMEWPKILTLRILSLPSE